MPEGLSLGALNKEIKQRAKKKRSELFALVHEENANRLLEEVQCHWEKCGKKFKRVRPTQQYCSPVCRVSHSKVLLNESDVRKDEVAMGIARHMNFSRKMKKIGLW